MSIEYTALVRPSEGPLVTRVLDDIGSIDGVEVIKSTPHSLSLRYKTATVDCHPMQEQVFVCVQDGSVYLAFHSGTREQRAHLMSEIEKVFSTYKISINFQEL